MLIHAFEQQVEKRPDKIAVKTEKKLFSYRELNRYADAIAASIRTTLPGDTPPAPGRIALFLDHGVDMIAAILGTLKAANAYVPIPFDYPPERISYILENSQAMLVVTNPECKEKANQLARQNKIPVLDIDTCKKNDAEVLPPPGTIAREIGGDRLAYIMYTSGSTGRPKGVMQTHANVLYYIENWTQRFSITDADRMTLFSSFCHDGSGQDMFGGLLNGATLYPYDLRSRESRVDIARLLIEEKITIWHSVPSLYNFFVNTLTGAERFDQLRCILLGGEPFRGYEIEMFKKYFPTSILANVYGQTESSVDSIWTIRAEDIIDRLIIGQPLSNTQVFVIDDSGQEVEPFEIGEIMIGCPHISPGYWRDEESSSLTFAEDPDYGRLYWTGDLGRLLPDGNIEFMGRNDFQVKIRGFRVEMGEIETTLLKMEQIREAVVVAKETGSTSIYLCAFISADKKLAVDQIREFLAYRLPDYMIPTSFIQLEKMPLTGSGKIDRKALAEMDSEPLKLRVNYAPPRTDMEKKVADSWKSILNQEKIGIADNFFDLGGNSFDIIQINNRLRTLLKRDIPLVKMFEYPTVKTLAGYLSGDKKEKKSPALRREQTVNKDAGAAAVIGMAGRFPGANNIHKYWENLKNGVESITFFSDETLRDAGIADDLIDNPDYVKAKGILEEIETFDAHFFNYTPRQAEAMDPQLRIFHECTWEALEDAGYDPATYDGSIGLYAGNLPNFYWQAMVHLGRRNNPLDQFESMLLSYHFSTRVSYNFNFNGPAITVQTACSTSMTAIHLAFTGLANYESDMALAGGVSIALPHKTGHLYQEGMLLSRDGHIRAFDAGASGTIFGDGAGVVVLKRCGDAVRDGDHIYAVIKGTAINNDGIRKVGYTAPSVEGQAEVIRAALEASHVEPQSIGYIETHGTGTILGDPIEMEALNQVFANNSRNSCAIGSVKTNVGHLNAAAGIASFIKTVLALKHKAIPPSLNFAVPNPGIDFIDSPFYVNTALAEWQNDRCPLRAGVSSFGFGGTNVHVVLEEAPPAKESSKSRAYQLILLSAATRNSLYKAMGNLAAFLEKNKDIPLADVAYTLQTRRKRFQYRAALVSSDAADAVNALTQPENGKVHEYYADNDDSKKSNPLAEIPGRDGAYVPVLLDKIGQAWLHGQTIDWDAFYKEETRKPVSLPTYAFDRQRYWIDDVDLDWRGDGAGKDTGRRPVKKSDKATKKSAALFPRPDLATPYIPPSNEIENGLVEICQALFGYEQIGIMDNFFELGGNSLSVINFVSEIHKELNTRIQIQDVFEKKSLQELSALIGEADKEQYFSIESVEKKEYYPLSPAQKSLYILVQGEKNISTAYNLPQAVIIEGALDKQCVETTFLLLIKRHQNFRTSFDVKAGKPVQIIHEQVDFKVRHDSLQSGAEEAVKEAVDRFIAPFDIIKAPLLRVELLRLGKKKHLLLLDMHHIISDGLSIAIMVREFFYLYQGDELAALRVQYKDFSEWQNSPSARKEMKKQETYWLDRFEGDVPTVNLATDYPRQSIKSFEGSSVQEEIGEELTKKIKTFMGETETTLYMVLLAAFNVLVSIYTEQEDIIVGVPAGGRSHPDLENIIGMFVNTLAMRNYPQKERSFGDFLQEVKTNALNAYANQDYPFEELVNRLGIAKNTGKNPLFDILFVSEDLGIPGLAVEGLTFTPFEFKRGTSHMDLVFYIVDAGDSILLKLEYDSTLFAQPSVEGMLRHFIEIVGTVVEHRDIRLAAITVSHELIVPQADILKGNEDDFDFSL